MMAYLSALQTMLIPLVFLLAPGFVIVPYLSGTALEKIARVFLASLAALTLGTLLAAAIGLPNYVVLIVLLLITAVWLWGHRALLTWAVARTLALHASIFALGLLALALPFFLLQYGSPTGDSQKAIFWAQQINDTYQLPAYSEAGALWNRDPVDFYTPGLHALTALLMRLTPYPLMAVGYFSLLLAIATAYIGAAFISQLFARTTRQHMLAWFVVALAANIRFLRYVREPGYHYQNLVGEFFLFSLLFLASALLQRWRWVDFALACLTAAALFVSHQFSMFLAAFFLLPYVALLVLRYAKRIPAKSSWTRYGGILFATAAVAAVLLIAVSADLFAKLPHLFSLNPHLLTLTPTIGEYVSLWGPFWLGATVAGALLIFRASAAVSSRTQAIAFSGVLIIVAALSQAPRFGIDIPPVRAFLYGALPFSIASAYFLTRLWHHAARISAARSVAYLCLLSAVTVIVIPTWVQAFTPAHTVRTNSTYLPEYAVVNEYLRAQNVGAVLLDDYNRRSTTWLILAQRPAYSRLAADIARQMTEAVQSPLRRELFIRQLEYEKVFSLGSRPEIAPLLEKHDIRWVTGIAGSSNAAFAVNPLFTPRVSVRDVTLYERSNAPVPQSSLSADTAAWLLHPATLANDIGDPEDTFAHLPASVRAPRLTDPTDRNGNTVRTTTSPRIPLRFNVSDYVRVLWNQQAAERPDIALEFLLVAEQLPPTLTLETPTGRNVPVTAGQVPIRLEPVDLPYDSEGNLTLILNNPTEAPVVLDLIALGLAHVP